MKLTFDMHTHSIASGHAFSTLQENIAAAQQKGLACLGLSEHGPAVKNSPDYLYFDNYKLLPRQFGNLRLYCGVEADIMDYDGHLDMDDALLSRMDYVIASMHTGCIEPGTEAQNTRASIMAMRHPCVKILGHPDDSRFPLNKEEIVLAAKEEKVAIEINNGSLHPKIARQNGRENICELLTLCKKHEVSVIINTDSHFSLHIGDFDYALEVIKEMQFPEHLILNTDPANVRKVVNVD